MFHFALLVRSDLQNSELIVYGDICIKNLNLEFKTKMSGRVLVYILAH